MNNNRPLAYRSRPKTFDEMVGQDHIIGKNGSIRKMLEHQKMFSLILYGDPGSGKTTIAQIIAETYGLNSFTFNASTDNKAQLSEIIQVSINYGALVIIDEIHRMNKNIQDFLLPHVENGNVIMIGLTTENPYHSVNPAVRSRCHVLKCNQLQDKDVVKRLKQVFFEYSEELSVELDDEVFDYIATAANRDIRSAINQLEVLSMAYSKEKIDLDKAKKVLFKPSLSLDKNADNYYNILSAFQKSIRGSDADAALHYLARLIMMEDLDSILRRMTVIAYEDIGFANPTIQAKMDACANACRAVGFPEARIPLSLLVIDMALSPKSNTAGSSIDQALKDLEQGKTYKIPNQIINMANYEEKDPYLYPHDYPDALVYQQYLPNELRNTKYYTPSSTTKYETALHARYQAVMKVLRKKK